MGTGYLNAGGLLQPHVVEALQHRIFFLLEFVRVPISFILTYDINARRSALVVR